MNSLTPSLSRTREILAGLAVRPKKRLGQNFLIDGNTARKSLSWAGIQKGGVAAEIGPGLGALTWPLLEAGAEVYAVEKDPALADYLNEECKRRNEKWAERFHLIQGDAIEYPLANLPVNPESAIRNPQFKAVSNLPYAITSPWLERVLRGPLPEQMVLMLQKEAAARHTACPGSKAFGAISVFLQSAYACEAAHNVSRRCFYPKPEVDSVLLNLRRKPHPFLFSGGTRALVRRLFTQRRKQLGSLCRENKRLSAWLKGLEKRGVSPRSRPEDIPLEAWRELENTVIGQKRTQAAGRLHAGRPVHFQRPRK